MARQQLVKRTHILAYNPKIADFQRFYLSVRGTFTTRSRRCTTRSKGSNPLQ